MMIGNSVRGRLLASTMVAGLALGAALPAAAQTSGEGQELGEVVITGSRIKRAETTTEAPVAVIDAQAIMDRGFVQAG